MMSSKERIQDVTFLLFLVPFALSAVYAIYLWVEAGISATLPQTVFLQVTENPYVFLAGFAAVMLAAILDINSVDLQERRRKLTQESNRLQFLAVSALVLGALCAWYAAGFDVGGGASNMLSGRYAVIFPVLLIAVSFLMLPSVNLNRSSTAYLLTLVCAAGSLASVDEVGKHNYFAGLALAAALVALAIYFYIYGVAAAQDAKDESSRTSGKSA
jgi:hypothetical protein